MTVTGTCLMVEIEELRLGKTMYVEDVKSMS